MKRLPAASPTRMAISGVIGKELAAPRMPSVPKYALAMQKLQNRQTLKD
jgi:hypothetical protein